MKFINWTLTFILGVEVAAVITFGGSPWNWVQIIALLVTTLLLTFKGEWIREHIIE